MNSNFGNIDREKAQKASDAISKNLGASADGLKEILSDEKKLQSILSKITPSDMDKIGDLLNNPDKLDSALSGKRAKDNIKKFLG